ncbi:mga helix-turn-helix domain protein, partial [Latilactobacillus curvatus]
MFSVPTDAYHYLLVNKSEAFDFIKILLKGETVTFQEFWEAHDTSKATALRHLKGVRDLIRSFDMVDCKFNPNFWTNLSASPD